MNTRINFAKKPTARLNLGTIHAGPIAAGVAVAVATGARMQENPASAFRNPTPCDPQPWAIFQVAKMSLNQRLRCQKK